VAELRRIKGELRLARSCDSAARRAAEEDLRAAVEISRAQGATLLALRGSVGLANLLAGTAQSDEALAVLARLRNEICEARDLPDVAEATARLDSIGDEIGGPDQC
jgi:hypothetical protein